jgi:hypothetical protein
MRRAYTFTAAGSTLGDHIVYVQLTKADSNPLNNADDAVINVFNIVDLAINITATPTTGAVGSNFTYTVNM